MNLNKQTYVLLAVLFVCFSELAAQQSLLTKRLDAIYTDQPIYLVLEDIQKKIGVNFSYQSTLIPKKDKITLNMSNTLLNGVLLKLFERYEITYKILNGQLVIYRKPGVKSIYKPQADQEIRLVYDTIYYHDTTYAEKLIPVYDTVITHQQDTIIVQTFDTVHVTTYDTILHIDTIYLEKKRKHNHPPELGVNLLLFGNVPFQSHKLPPLAMNFSQQIYTTYAPELNFSIGRDKWKTELGLSYQQIILNQRFSLNDTSVQDVINTQVTPYSVTMVDTVSYYYEINGIDTTIHYLVDSTNVTAFDTIYIPSKDTSISSNPYSFRNHWSYIQIPINVKYALFTSEHWKIYSNIGLRFGFLIFSEGSTLSSEYKERLDLWKYSTKLLVSGELGVSTSYSMSNSWSLIADASYTHNFGNLYMNNPFSVIITQLRMGMGIAYSF